MDHPAPAIGRIVVGSKQAGREPGGKPLGRCVAPRRRSYCSRCPDRRDRARPASPRRQGQMRATLWCRPLDRLRSGLLLGVAILLAGARVGWAQSAQAAQVAAPATPAASASQAKPDSGKKMPPEQLQMLVAPVALYPDDLLMQTLRGVHVSARDRSAAAVDGEEPESEGQGARGFCRQNAVGPLDSVHGSAARCGQTPFRRHPVDDRPGQRIPRAAGRRDGRRAGDAEEGEGQGRAHVERQAEGRDPGRREEGQ